MPFSIPSPASKKHARIEIIPLIDVIFFLLATFVMVSLSMVKNKGIPVNLPAAASAQPQDRKDFASITLTEKGEVYFNKQIVSTAELEIALKDLLAQNPEPKVFINGDNKAEFGKAVEALDIARRLGITKIAIETKLKPAAGAPPAPGAGPVAPGATVPSNPAPAPAAPAPTAPAAGTTPGAK